MEVISEKQEKNFSLSSVINSTSLGFDLLKQIELLQFRDNSLLHLKSSVLTRVAIFCPYSNPSLLAVYVFQDHPRKIIIREIATKYLLYYLRII